MISRFVICTTGRELSEAARQAIELAAKAAAWDYLDPIQQAQLRATRPDLFQEGQPK